jgi:hypothetical protein
VALPALLEHPDDAALRSAVRAAPGADRTAAGELVRHGLEHRLHLGRQAGQDVDVLEDEAGRAAERILERATPSRQLGPAGDVLRIACEAGAQGLCHGRLFLLGHRERGSDRLTGDVVWSPAETAGDEHDVGLGGLPAHECRDPLLLVGERRDHQDVDAERLEPRREPRAVRVDRVAGDKLVPDRHDRGGRHRASIAHGGDEPRGLRLWARWPIEGVRVAC